MGQQDVDRLKEALRSAAKDDRIQCPQALELARREGVDSKQVARLLDELGVKIKGCQLGCF